MGNDKNGIVLKVSLGFVTTLIMIILGFSISGANNACKKADSNTIDIRKMEVEQKYTREAIQEIKKDIREIKQAVVK